MKLRVFFGFCFLLFTENVLRADDFNTSVENMRKKIFESDPGKPACKLMGRSFDNTIGKFDPVLEKMISDILKSLKDEDSVLLSSFFHARLGVNAAKLKDTVFSEIEQTYKPPRSFTLYRIWALNTTAGGTALIPCAEDGVSLSPHYGYPLQIALWIQVMGENELGRIYATLVPAKDKWNIGTWQLRQWTHKGLDGEAWAKQALDDIDKKQNFTAYVKLSVAEKLLNGGGYLFTDLEKKIAATKDSLYSDAAWLKEIQSTLKKWDVVYAGTILADDGVGVLVRISVDEKTDTKGLKDTCSQIGKQLYQKIPPSSLGGIQCGFVTKNEDPRRDGQKGSIFLIRSAF